MWIHSHWWGIVLQWESSGSHPALPRVGMRRAACSEGRGSGSPGRRKEPIFQLKKKKINLLHFFFPCGQQPLKRRERYPNLSGTLVWDGAAVAVGGGGFPTVFSSKPSDFGPRLVFNTLPMAVPASPCSQLWLRAMLVPHWGRAKLSCKPSKFWLIPLLAQHIPCTNTLLLSNSINNSPFISHSNTLGRIIQFKSQLL